MRRISIVIGLILLMLPASTGAVGESLYKQIRRFTEHEFMFGPVELAVEKFAKKVYPNPLIEIADEDTDFSLQQLYINLCSKKHDGITYDSCAAIAETLPQIAKRTEWLRAAGRELQIAASSYEMNLNEAPSGQSSLLLRMTGIVNIWQSEADRYAGGADEANIRLEQYPEDFEEKLEAVGTTLEELIVKGGSPDVSRHCEEEIRDSIYCEEIFPGAKEDIEKFTAAIWRYRHGVRQVEREGKEADEEASPCESDGVGDGTELQHLKTRWCTVEEKLKDVLEALPDPEEYDPPLSDGETALFPSYDLENGVLVWIRSDDVGLTWKVPVEPVLPSLDCDESTQDQEECISGAILGGLYSDPPEEPESGKKLCSHPLAGRGYLCRPIVAAWCADQADEDGDGTAGTDVDLGGEVTITTDDGTITLGGEITFGNDGRADAGGEGGLIVLTECRTPPFDTKTPTFLSESGPNICYGGPWRFSPKKGREGDEAEKAARYDLSQCRNCDIQISCGACGLVPSTEEKDTDGVIKICLPPNPIPSSYLMLHELALAQQFCNLPHGSTEASIRKDPTFEATSCCARQYQAHLVMCNAMAEDGVFSGTDITAEKCAFASVQVSCQGEERCDFGVDPQELLETQLSIVELAVKNPGGASDECSEDPEQLDERSKRLFYSMPGLCNPNCVSQFKNSIGNNLCFTGQCMEQAFEEHNVQTFGRMPFGVVDEAFPLQSCVQTETLSGSSLVVSVPPTLVTKLPEHRLRLHVLEIDKAICQINGLPALTPPVLCTVDAVRRISLPLKTIFGMGASLLSQPTEYGTPSDALESMIQGIGARMGTTFFVDHLTTFSRSLEELLTLATSLMKTIAKTEFPTTMCPRTIEVGEDGDEAICLTTVTPETIEEAEETAQEYLKPTP